MWIDRWIRWRSRKGFGVHSPLAYRFLCDVVHQDYQYYDYKRLDTSAERLLYRLAVFIQPSVIKSINKGNIRPARMACPDKGHRTPPRYIDADETRLAVASRDTSDAQIEKLLAEGYCIFMQTTAGDAARLAMDQLGHGMIFNIGQRLSILLPLHQLPRQDFSF